MQESCLSEQNDLSNDSISVNDPTQYQFYVDVKDLSFGEPITKKGKKKITLESVIKGSYKGQEVAIKTQKRSDPDLTSARNRRVFKEAMLLSELNHPNINMFVGLAYDADHFYYISEHMVQRSLFEALHSEHILLTPKCIYKMLNDIASALQFIHASKIVNGNLKSRSILMQNCWDFKINNFGPEKVFNRIRHLRKEKPKCSSLPYWLPPEAFVRGQFDLKGDIYSFGMLIW